MDVVIVLRGWDSDYGFGNCAFCHGPVYFQRHGSIGRCECGHSYRRDWHVARLQEPTPESDLTDKPK